EFFMSSSDCSPHSSGELGAPLASVAEDGKTSRPIDPEFLFGLTPLGRRRLRMRLSLLLQVEGGAPLSTALRESRLNITLRSAQLLVRSYRRHGLDALVDGRSVSRVPGRNPRTARTPVVESLIRRLLTNGVAQPRGIQRALAPVCASLGLSVPSASTIR